MDRRELKRRVARRGGLLAHMVTFTNLACGFAAILLIMEQHYALAVSLVFLSGVLDFFDGALARLSGHGSSFGKELDSLADLVSFGIVPALFSYSSQSGPPQAVIGIVSASFALAGAWRLALFNTMEAGRDFRGMPITVAGMLMGALAYMSREAGVWPWPVLAGLTLGLALLMVCPVRFIKLSRVVTGLLRRRPDAIWWALLPFAVLSVVTILGPFPWVVVSLGIVYIISSLITDRRAARPAPRAGEIRG
ncbi:MAG: CDP-diacylglycerol--serine O-phosphatidyltransferase [Chloroflexota bacterium]